MDLSLILSAAVGLIAGAVVALRVIAPKTKTTKDDEVLKRLEAVESVLGKLVK